MLNSGIYPDQVKTSKVVPLYKANDKSVLTNYRPIALLPSISKIFEYILFEQLTNHFIEHKLLSPVVACQRYVCPNVIFMTMNVIIQECIIENCFIEPYV